MKKIGYKQSCNGYVLDKLRLQKTLSKGVSIEKACWSCHFYLFGVCWLNEKDKVVKFALDGVEWAKQELHAH